MVTIVGVGSVVVIGGGIAGIQAALDLAESGIHVFLIEKEPSIGGKMSALDKTFPTLDCSICIEAPKMSEVMQHPNIEVHTMTEVIGVQGTVGDFTVRLRERARYVTDECTRCGECALVCPNIRPNEFDHGVGFRKGIYTPFQQSEPGSYVIDMDACLNDPPNYLPCDRCVEACLPKCINFTMNPFHEYDVECRSIIIATGFDLLEPALLKEYGYGEHPDIMTSIEFERMLNSAGPTMGQILRPSNFTEPENILFILCVGSRDQRLCQYCSRVCCMYSIKEAIQSIDHGIKSVTILFMDIRAYGKGFDEFYNRSIVEGVRYVRGHPAKIQTSGDKPAVVYENMDNSRLVEEEYDLVVLTPSLLPSKGAGPLSQALGIDLDPEGFIIGNSVDGLQVATSCPGIYACGCATGPKDIPDSVTEASAAAAAAMTHVKDRSWPEEDFQETIDPLEETKVGVFVCDCGSNIAGVVDVPSVVEYANTIPGVVHSEEVMFACAGSTQGEIAERMQEKGINRLVIAACSPKTHNPTFQRVCMQAGLNTYLLEMSNIRNHDSWVHKNFPVKATEKAKDMVLMAGEKAKLLSPKKEIEVPVIQRALVIGGGIAGMSAAMNLSSQGFETHLIERSGFLGGNLRELSRFGYSGASAQVLLHQWERNLISSGVHVHLHSTIESVGGYIGNFTVILRSDDGESADKETGKSARDKDQLSEGKGKNAHGENGPGEGHGELEVGVIIVATGARESVPGEYLYGQDTRVMTQRELGKKIEKGLHLENKTAVMIQCVGSRDEEHPYCSRVCCAEAVKNAIILKERFPDSMIFILYRDLRTTGLLERFYEKAREMGVIFLRYDLDNKPVVGWEEGGENGKTILIEGSGTGNGELKVKVHNQILDEDMIIAADHVILSPAIIPREDSEELSQILRVPLNEDGFFLEAHQKLRPVDFSTEGIFLAGMGHSPKPVEESISQGFAAASRASTLLSKGKVMKEPLAAIIDPEICTGCHLCVASCPYNAIEGEKGKPHRVIEASCMGCGTCAGECPFGAITMPGFTDEQIFSQIDAALANDPEKKVLVFTCNWCSYAAADQAGISKIQYPSSSRIIRTMCSGRISRRLVDRAFEKGAGAVLLTGCRLTDKGSDCHYNHANVQTLRRFERWQKEIAKKGIDPQRFQLQWASASEGKILAQKLGEMDAFIKSVYQGN